MPAGTIHLWINLHIRARHLIERLPRVGIRLELPYIAHDRRARGHAVLFSLLRRDIGEHLLAGPSQPHHRVEHAEHCIALRHIDLLPEHGNDGNLGARPLARIKNLQPIGDVLLYLAAIARLGVVIIDAPILGNEHILLRDPSWCREAVRFCEIALLCLGVRAAKVPLPHYVQDKAPLHVREVSFFGVRVHQHRKRVLDSPNARLNLLVIAGAPSAYPEEAKTAVNCALEGVGVRRLSIGLVFNAFDER